MLVQGSACTSAPTALAAHPQRRLPAALISFQPSSGSSKSSCGGRYVDSRAGPARPCCAFRSQRLVGDIQPELLRPPGYWVASTMHSTAPVAQQRRLAGPCAHAVGSPARAALPSAPRRRTLRCSAIKEDSSAQEQPSLRDRAASLLTGLAASALVSRTFALVALG